MDEKAKINNNEIVCSYDQFDSKEYLGDQARAKSPLREIDVLYTLYNINNNISQPNRLFMIIGMIFAISGSLIILLERRLRTVFPSKS